MDGREGEPGEVAGVTAGTPEVGLFMAIETLSLEVEGELSLWRALAEVRMDYPPLADTDLDGLIARAKARTTHWRPSASPPAFACSARNKALRSAPGPCLTQPGQGSTTSGREPGR